MPTVWIPEAEDLAAVGTSGDMLGGPPRAVWHTTEAPSGFSRAGTAYFDLMHRVLTGKAAEPHILWDPITDRMGQFFPLNRSSRSLKNDAASGTSTNKTGVTCIQIEVVGYASSPFTDYWKPGPNYRALMAAIRSWGIPDRWPGGRMSAAGEDVSRSLTTWKTEAGHYGHCHVPGNSHWDCGAVDQQAIFHAASTPAPTQQEDPFMALTDSEQRELLEAARYLKQGGTGDRFIHEIPARANTYVAQSVAALVRDLDVDEAALAAGLAPLLASAVIAAIGDAKGITADDVEAAVRRVFADAATP